MAPERTIGRLVIYRILLQRLMKQGTPFVFSKQLAEMSGSTAAQVRRDLMFVGYLGSPQRGYDVRELLECIRKLLEPEDGITMTLIGVGNLGRAILGYFAAQRPRFSLVAAFDTDPEKAGRVISGCRCYNISEMPDVLADQHIQLGVITVPGAFAQTAADRLIDAHVKGIVNFAPVPVQVPRSVYLENMHMTMTFEKVAYFARLGQTSETTPAVTALGTTL